MLTVAAPPAPDSTTFEYCSVCPVPQLSSGLLRRSGHAKVKVKVTYTPQRGKPLKVSKRIRLIERPLV
jgi:hypothetical protein